MSYKDRVLLTLLVLLIFFGWLMAQNITPDIEEITTGQYVDGVWVEHQTNTRQIFSGRDWLGFVDVPQNAPVIVTKTLQDKVFRCKLSPTCTKLAEAVVYEARGEPLQGRYAVASVIMNRVDSKRFPNSIKAVITQSNQFSYLKDMRKQATPDKKDWTEGYLVAYDTLYGEIERITSADHYFNPRKVVRIPSWSRVYQRVLVIGNHDFYVSN